MESLPGWLFRYTTERTVDGRFELEHRRVIEQIPVLPGETILFGEEGTRIHTRYSRLYPRRILKEFPHFSCVVYNDVSRFSPSLSIVRSKDSFERVEHVGTVREFQIGPDTFEVGFVEPQLTQFLFYLSVISHPVRVRRWGYLSAERGLAFNPFGVPTDYDTRDYPGDSYLQTHDFIRTLVYLDKETGRLCVQNDKTFSASYSHSYMQGKVGRFYFAAANKLGFLKMDSLL